MNKEQIKGRYEEAKGKVKEAAGQIVGDEHLQQAGIDQQNSGKVQAEAGDLKEKIKKID